VLAIHEVGDAGGVPYIVMELVAGSTLRDRLEASPIALGEALAIALEIAQGLAAAHQQGVVHRDLKPENVALAADGRVKLLDFGLARFDTSPEPYGDTVPGSPHLTRDGQVLGTPAYMSPEQALGEPVDSRSDVFSFGTLLFELVTGRCPFARHTSEDTRRAVIDAALPEGWQARVPGVLASLISRATEREPLRRFASGAELVAALEAVGHSRGTLAAS
jgi:serine/threonine protein kinase